MYNFFLYKCVGGGGGGEDIIARNDFDLAPFENRFEICVE